MSGIGSGGRDDGVRLAAVARATDDWTVAALEEVLPRDGGQCDVLEVGCGTGSVAIELARRRPAIRVWALDPDLALLPAADRRPANLRPVRSRVQDWTPPTRFALVHARFVLSHLPDREAVCTRLADWLVPGGHLVVTDPVHLDLGGGGPVARVLAAYRAVAEADGLAFTFAPALPGLFLGAGLTDVDLRARPARLGGGPGVDRWAPLVRRVEDRLAGVTPADLAAFHAHAESPATWSVPQILLTVTGRAPARAGRGRAGPRRV
ncbi:class I SAM-dependent methyltransferase [Pseudonocardia sp. HH130630-07]|uniref:class I SAM-dependent methyltransferase n=1 Tax=Pseudonocardia sp. HH130630-07 TaxID=1690815 RepID=UPI000814E2DF|nr:class I SAM-dependent methyltransferase [Pseudonocardia sp. HH130630-07]ANY05571.1 hypothetical protein AFB00_03785 [Pseudonocardia sp. HH130630-07]